VPQPELAGWLSRSTALVLPSIEDGYGLVMLQAMACGCPVIASTNTGGLDCIEQGGNGFIVPVADPDAIADRLTWLAGNPDAARAMRAAAIAQAAHASNVVQYGDAMMSVYRTLLSDGAAAAARLRPPDGAVQAACPV
jgi:glycosyltransferase involved in cell wall biosynthesis